MTRFPISRNVRIIGFAVASLAGCGGSQPPIGAPGAMPQAQAITKRVSSTYKVLYRFRREESVDGYYPVAPLIEVNGTFYGTTEFGGSTTGLCAGSNPGCGTVYSVSPSGVEHVLHAFTAGSDGAFPVAGLTDVNGTLYGTTAYGGSSNNGVVFSISTSGAEHVLYSFTGSPDGSRPRANLIYANGLLYGTTAVGGDYCGFTSSGCGTVFTISTSGTETVIYRFAGGADDGAEPVSGLIEANGTFYGTTYQGGDVLYCDCGTVYSITSSGNERMLLRAESIDGAGPDAGLVDVAGTMYGTMTGGETNLEEDGTVYSITPAGEAKVLHELGGRGAVSGLTAVNGTLYGTREYGGSYTCSRPRRPRNHEGCGFLYSITTSGSFQVLHNFTGRGGGAFPHAALLDVNGTLYGTTCCTHDQVPWSVKGPGTVFAFTP